MTFSYDATLSTDKDKVRMLIGDKTDAGHLFENEEIVALLATIPDVNLCAAYLLDSTAASYARKADKAIGQTRIMLSQAFQNLTAMADRLRSGVAGGDGSGVATVGVMSVGGISIDERTDLRSGDVDRIQPEFHLHQNDNGANQTVFAPLRED